MHLLVSVRSAAEAAAALAGGADIVDAKEPHAGALGAVSLDVLRGIHRVVATRRPLSAAIGDATDEAAIERTAREVAAAGALFVKVGFSGIAGATRMAALAAAAHRGVVDGSAGRSALVAVGYADADETVSLVPSALVDLAARAGARAVLLDTANKNGPGLRALIDPDVLAAWVAHAHASGLRVALAGKLTADDLPFVRDTGADIAGVRAAACEGGRTGRVTPERVAALARRNGDVVPFDASWQSTAPIATRRFDQRR